MELETQVAKILIENAKTANSYVFAVAEKSFDATSELFSVVELPLFNPAASADCERIAKAVAASLKRSYRRTPNESTFENALSQINEELAKLATMGQTHWVGKLNALVATKTGNVFNIATTGKITALLFREGEFNNLADSPKNPHPLKTFENFATGRIKLHDFLILSSSQLFNYLSIDRLKNIIRENTLPLAGQQIIHILQENAGPEVAFATLITLQVEPGTTPDGEIDLEEFVDNTTHTSLFEKIKETLVSAAKDGYTFGLNSFKKLTGRFKATPKLDVSNLNVKNIVDKNKKAWSKVKGGMQTATNTFRVDSIKKFSTQKKFFFLAAIILFLALVTNIVVGSYYSKNKEKNETAKQLITEMNKLVDDANGALLYKADEEAQSILKQLQEKAPGLANVAESDKPEADKVKQKIEELVQKIEKVSKVEAQNIATLGNADNLINLPNLIAVEVNRNIVSYNKTNGATQDGVLVSAESIISSTFAKGSQAVIYNGQNLYLWNFGSNLLGQAFSESVPNDKQAVGLRYYSANNKVYTVDKKNNRILSFSVGDKALSNPVVSVQGQGDLSSAQDLAVDGSIYVLLSGNVVKFQSGQMTDFKLPTLSKNLSDKGKIYTELGYTNLYILDSGNKRIIILDKKGGIVKIITSDQFTNLRDFIVDEKGKAIFLLNDTSLLKVNF